MKLGRDHTNAERELLSPLASVLWIVGVIAVIVLAVVFW